MGTASLKTVVKENMKMKYVQTFLTAKQKTVQKDTPNRAETFKVKELVGSKEAVPTSMFSRNRVKISSWSRSLQAISKKF